jgi:general secretion pathway protein G
MSQDEPRSIPARRASGMNRKLSGISPKSGRNHGFTMLELMVVMSIIAILLAIAIPTYSRSIVAARERTLRSDLALLRADIWKYTFDKQKAPQSLDDLRSAGYIKKIPDDPITKQPDWEPVQEENVLLFAGQQDSGIIDVHSASTATATDGTAYNTW